MSTINSRQHRFLQICVGLGCLGTLPFLVHPLGLERPDALDVFHTQLSHTIILVISISAQSTMGLVKQVLEKKSIGGWINL